MTTATAAARAVHPARPAAAPAPTEALYTICPVLAASNVAAELGWLDEEFQRVGAKATYLRSLPDNAGPEAFLTKLRVVAVHGQQG